MKVLTPSRSHLSAEYVLMQAWKKSSSYIRHHNWFADTLSLDQTTANLPQFIERLADDLASGDWESEPLRLVAAPKSQSWVVDKAGNWKPSSGGDGVKLRPLAHASIRDQVAATAVMLCLADRVETLQGDPRLSLDDARAQGVVSYGNRLFCDRDSVTGELRHRWGSSKLYRGYFQDYRSFISRPELFSDKISKETFSRVAIVQADLSQFYDRVTPGLLNSKLAGIIRPDDDQEFALIAQRILKWEWHRSDQSDAKEYASVSGIPSFDTVALPQGLVSAGFFANLVLLDFDRELAANCGQEIAPGIILRDVSRYVDDLRLVVTTELVIEAAEIEAKVSDWLNASLKDTAAGLSLKKEKTRAALFREETRPLLRQSRRMARIQTAISGGFDADGGEKIIEAVQGLVRAQDHFSGTDKEAQSAFAPVPDVRSDTVSRFAASRFRRTYRSLRPLLDESASGSEGDESSEDELRRLRPVDVSRGDLDDDAQAFALSLVDKWVRDPSNVRLLRIALDIWPAKDLLSKVLELLTPYTRRAGKARAKKVAYYCLSEIFRAGATETGFVDDEECLPKSVDLQAFRNLLSKEAVTLLKATAASIPWYLKQQALLYLATHNPQKAPISLRNRSAETKLYRDLICFLRGETKNYSSTELATLTVMSRSMVGLEKAIELARPLLDEKLLRQIALRDPSLAFELRMQSETLSRRVVPAPAPREGAITLEDAVLDTGPLNPLRNELGVLSFARAFVSYIKHAPTASSLTPRNVVIKRSSIHGLDQVSEVTTVRVQDSELDMLYSTPKWCTEDERWRFQLGFLMRFILSARWDFTLSGNIDGGQHYVSYRPTRSHWHQRIYGLYNGHNAFGDDWLPISQDVQDLLFSLLAWPGCCPGNATWVRGDLDSVERRLVQLENTALASIGEATKTLFLKVPAPVCDPVTHEGRPLRACVVQTVTPDVADFMAATDLQLDDSAIRRKHRNHLSTALAAVEKMLALRETHKSHNKRLDWLILPELAVHSADIYTHLIPFARAYRTVILAGLVYEELVPNQPLVNSAIWIIPRTTPEYGLQVEIRRQGKQHLAPIEHQINSSSVKIHGFRPCQWLVGYEWSHQSDPLWLTSAICYDATDIKLASDLKHRSDVFAIPALNQDVGTFDQMSLALHYHMYQMVIIANNGCFGGSNAHTPLKEPYLKQVFHTHGQPQATISFLEIDDIKYMKDRHSIGRTTSNTNPRPSGPGIWKYPPAG